jgi:hypothetical protein
VSALRKTEGGEVNAAPSAQANPSLPPAVEAEVRKILAREARRLLIERASAPSIQPRADQDGDPA